MSNLGNQASKCSLDKVADALPPALKKSVLQSLNFSTFVWVIKNKDDANKIVKVLRENGFSNISLDSKGTTITAQSSSGSQSAGNYVTSNSSTALAQAPNNNCQDVYYPNCQNYYQIYDGEIEYCATCNPENGLSCTIAPGCTYGNFLI